jgi:hypothetical protein
MKTKIEKRYGSFVVTFTQGVQTFHIPNLEKTKKHAVWQKEMLDKAFENFKKEVLSEPPAAQVIGRDELIKFASYNFKEALRVNYDLIEIGKYVDKYLSTHPLQEKPTDSDIRKRANIYVSEKQSRLREFGLVARAYIQGATDAINGQIPVKKG